MPLPFRSALAFCLAASCVASGCATRGAPPSSETMQVRGRHLYSAAGERVVLRGVNEMFAWSDDRTGRTILPQIARTGANAVRIVTMPDFTARDLDRVVANSVRHGMIPMVECHAATGKWEQLGACVDYWTRPEIAATIRKHRRWVLLNIANEAGGEVSREAFLAGYRDAIARIRAAGIDVPLVIDGSDWGKEYRMLLDSWGPLNAADPLGRIVVSAHSYWAGTQQERQAPYREIIERVLAENIPFVMGEGPTPAGFDCQPSPYEWAMAELDRAEIGWLAWSWGAVTNADCGTTQSFDLTRGGRFGAWASPAAEALMVSHPASVRNTARRPCSIPRAGPNCTRPGRSEPM